MNILFLIGNGFDLNFGLKTKYGDFYKFYLNRTSKTENINIFKAKISKEIKNWSDLEFAFGEYTKELTSEEDFYEVYSDLEDELATYLETEEKKINVENFDRQKLFQDFSNPNERLPPTDKKKLEEFKNKWANYNTWNLSIITFNYTRILETLFENINDIKLRSNNHSINLTQIEHIHGYTNERMVLGVNDTSQISNTNFHKNQTILESLVKNDCNKAQKHGLELKCAEWIRKANMIYIFGSSIGDTDKIWWDLIGQQLKRGSQLVIFEKTKEFSPRRPQEKTRVEREKINSFLNKTSLTKEEKNNLKKNITIGVNTNLFKVKSV